MGQVNVKVMMNELKLKGMLEVFDEQMIKNQRNKTQLIKFIDHLLQKEIEYREEKAVEGLIRRAKFKGKSRMEDFDYTFERSIDQSDIEDLYSLSWLHDKRDILIMGPTGIGKTFLSQALGYHCCLNKRKSYYLDMNFYLEELHIARQTGNYLKYLTKLSKLDILILDDFGLKKLTASEASDLCDLIKNRIDKSTVFTTQLPLDHWFEVIGDPVIADTIVDRLLHTSIKINLKGDSYRKVEGEKFKKKTH